MNDAIPRHEDPWTWNRILEACRAEGGGDKRLLEVAFEHFHPMVFQIAHRMTGDALDADDLTQEVFLALLAQLKTLDHAKLPGWLKRVARNKALERIRASSRRDARLERLRAIQTQLHGRTEDPTALQAMMVWDILHALPVEERSVIVLLYVEGCTATEATELLGISSATMYRRCERARARIREMGEQEPTIRALLREMGEHNDG